MTVKFLNEDAKYTPQNIVSQIKWDEIDSLVILSIGKDGSTGISVSLMPYQELCFLKVFFDQYLFKISPHVPTK